MKKNNIHFVSLCTLIHFLFKNSRSKSASRPKFTKTELYARSQYICAWFGLVVPLLMVFLKNALMCIKKVKLINHDCLPIWMLYIMLAYLMLFAALSNAVCLHNALFVFIAIDFCKCFLFHVLSLFIDT